jgi:hypothetical protein
MFLQNLPIPATVDLADLGNKLNKKLPIFRYRKQNNQMKSNKLPDAQMVFY